MRYSALHGSPGPAFDRFDPARGGSQSGYDHAARVACFTSSFDVAMAYAERSGFIGRFAFTLENPLDVDDRARPMGIASFLEHARELGHDGVILRQCTHSAMSPGEPSDLFFVFDLAAPRHVETVQDGPDVDATPDTSPTAHRSATRRPRR